MFFCNINSNTTLERKTVQPSSNKPSYAHTHNVNKFYCIRALWEENFPRYGFDDEEKRNLRGKRKR